MSWIVSHLLRNRTKIREDILKTLEVESTEYQDLLTVEKAVSDLVELKVLSQKDKSLLDSLSYGETFTAKSKTKSSSIKKRFNRISRDIAKHLGGYFTDEGYLAYVKEKYSLSDEDLAIMSYYIKSINKYNIIRNPISYDEVISKTRE